jgi:hypothetical protein
MPKLEREQHESEEVLFTLLEELSSESANRIIENIRRQGVELDFKNKVMIKKDA